MSRLPKPQVPRRCERVEREFFDLFIGLGRGELLPYGSYYLTGFLHDRPLARLREDLAKIGIARAEGVVEPEDHAGILCEIMSGLASRRLPAPPGSDRMIFDKHMAPWIGRFFTDLERADSSGFLSAAGYARPRLHGHRSGSLRTAGVRRAKDDIGNSEEGTAMKQQDKSKLGRRDFLRAMGAGAGVAVTAAAPLAGEAAAAESDADKKKARYKETDHVKAYYRSTVIRAEGGRTVLIKRTERQTRRSNLAATVGSQSGGFDRRTFLRRSGLVAGGLAAHRRAAARQRAQGGSGRTRAWPAPPSARTSARIVRSAAP